MDKHPGTKHYQDCAFCLLAANYESWELINSRIPIIGNKYRNSDIKIKDEETKLLCILAGSIDGDMEYLMQHALRGGIKTFEAYLSISRNTIERIANVNFLLTNNSEKKQQERKSMYADLLSNNVYDVLEFLNTKDPEASAKRWLDQEWTSFDLSTRAGLLHPYIKLIYGYISRVSHTVNRDGYLIEDETEAFIKLYLFYRIIYVYNDVHLLLPNSVSSKTLKELHQSLNEELEAIWEKYDTYPEALIALTSFGQEIRPTIYDVFFKNYKQKMKIASKHNSLPKPVLINNSPIVL